MRPVFAFFHVEIHFHSSLNLRKAENGKCISDPSYTFERAFTSSKIDSLISGKSKFICYDSAFLGAYFLHLTVCPQST